MAKVIVYTKDPCPFCVHAIRLLTEKKVPFQEIDLTDQPDEIAKIKEQTGWMTVPIILIDGKLIGGYQDMKRLDEEGELDRLLSLN